MCIYLVLLLWASAPTSPLMATGHRCMWKSLETLPPAETLERAWPMGWLTGAACQPLGTCGEGAGSQSWRGSQPTRAPEFSPGGSAVVGTLPVAASLGRKSSEGKLVRLAVWFPEPCGS